MQTYLSRTLAGLLAVALWTLSAPAHAAAPASFVEDSTGTKFDGTQTIGTTTYQCVGVGVRKVFIFVKVYAAAFCVEPAALKAINDYVAGKGKAPDLADKLNDDEAFFKAVQTAPGGKFVRMQLTHDITADRMAEAFRDAMSKVLPKEKVDKLIATIPGDAKVGQVVKIYSVGDSLTIDINGTAKKIDDAEIAQNLWAVWLGKDGVSPPLKKSIATTAAQGL